MTKLTQEQRAKVATIVTGEEYYVNEEDEIVTHNLTIWGPEISEHVEGYWMLRSQTFAIVEWLSDYLGQNRSPDGKVSDEYRAQLILTHVVNKDVNVLESMVLELTDE